MLATDYPLRVAKSSKCQFGIFTIEQIQQYLTNIGYLKPLQLPLDALTRSYDDFERKGKLSKKSLNSDHFKERVFVLDVSNLFYFKSERNKESYNLVVLLNATIKMFDFETLKNKQILLPSYLNKSTPFILEIQNATRKYVLAAKS